MPPIDDAVFADLRNATGAEFVVELVATFADEAPLLVAELRAALEARAADRFRRAAHSLKSNGHTFGATRVAEAAKALELGGLPVDGASVDALAAELDQALAALRVLAHA